MDIHMMKELILQYKSASQRARVLTENWVEYNLYCPHCGNPQLNHCTNNKPVEDFYCSECGTQYELKSRNGCMAHKITDGSYDAMISRITGNKGPDFLFMNYTMTSYEVTDLVLVPRYFFVPDIIEKRKPLSQNAQRAGWVGCNILVDEIPEQGKIKIISEKIVIDKESVVRETNRRENLNINDINSRGWLMDVLKCVNYMPSDVFALDDLYKYDKDLQYKHPQNNNIRPKIRQQLQILRDKGYIEFLGRGVYRKVGQVQ